jgi:hypothetical protein
MESPSLVWALTASETSTLRVLNAIGARLPLSSWRPRTLLRGRERLARTLGMGELQLAGTMPSGHRGVLMPQRMYFVEDSRATVDGVDLGRPIHAKPNPTIGDVPLPARGVLAIGQAMWEILDPAEYERTASETQATPAPEGTTT